jgi:hypothetical protein
MKKVASDTVVMTGINPTAQLTEYTFAKLENGKIRAKTTRIALGGFINFWIGSANGKHYFADMGGNPNDTNTDFNLPAQTIFSSSGSMANYLSTRVRMPIAGTVHNGKLLLVSGEAIGSPKGKIVEVDPQTQQMRVLFTSQNGNLGTLNVIPGTQDVMTNARGENKLIVFDSVTGQIRREIPTQGYSRSFDFTGHCVVVGNDENNSIEVFDLKSQDNKSVINEKITLPSKEFSGIKQIAVDDSTGIVFARSSLPCNPMMEVCDKDINRVVTFGAELGNSIRTLCH